MSFSLFPFGALKSIKFCLSGPSHSVYSLSSAVFLPGNWSLTLNLIINKKSCIKSNLIICMLSKQACKQGTMTIINVRIWVWPINKSNLRYSIAYCREYKKFSSKILDQDDTASPISGQPRRYGQISRNIQSAKTKARGTDNLNRLIIRSEIEF